MIMAANSQLAKLQADVDSIVEQLRASGIPYHFPESVDKQHSTKYRLAGHTKGNTKDQRKKMRRQHLQFLTDSRIHLQSTLDAATVATTGQPTQKTCDSRSTQKDEELDEDETQNLIQQAQKTLQSPNAAMVEDERVDDDRHRQHHYHEGVDQLGKTSNRRGHTNFTNKFEQQDRHCVENDTSTDESEEETPTWMAQFVPSLTD
eukprot:m.162291 g.162291  ORF g.162291 m.162291 type:complete len:204 (-) comp31274_c0_seq1:489-1100(-)